jgi:3-deoxy-D-manno-octulosonic-acid transferase
MTAEGCTHGAAAVAYRLSYAAYDVVGILAGLIALPFLPLLALTRHGRGLDERLGRLPLTVRRLQQPIWVHAASVGEVLAAQPLIDQLRRHTADAAVLVTTTSLTGRQTAMAQSGADAVMLLPIDIRWIVNRGMRRLRPRALVIVETEIWPALLRSAARAQVPCTFVSARVSPRAARRYAWIRWLTRAALSRVYMFAMQSESDAARIIAMGAPAERVHVVGSLKSARQSGRMSIGQSGSQPLVQGDRPALMAASTHLGEERFVLEACAGLWADFPNLLLIIAPRRPERFDEVDQLIARAGLVRQRRSQVQHGVASGTQILLLDTIGELPDLLPAVRAVFVGGTIAPIGGHNVLEPALCGKAVAFGPHTANVAAVAQALLAAAAATEVRTSQDLHAEWRRLLQSPQTAEAMGGRGRTVVAAGAAVAERAAAIVLQSLAEA